MTGLAEGSQRDPEEQRKDHDLQQLVFAQGVAAGGVDDRGRDQLVGDEGDEAGILHADLETVELGFAGGDLFGIRRQQPGADARFKQVGENQPEEQGYQRSNHEPSQGFDADPADTAGVAHVRDADDQGRKNQRRDDHLDGAQEQGGQQCDVRHVDGDMAGIDQPAEPDAGEHGDHDPQRQAPGAVGIRFIRCRHSASLAPLPAPSIQPFALCGHGPIRSSRK